MTLLIFHRSPRTYLAPPTAELELQPPQGKPARPVSSLMAVLAQPLISASLSLIVTIYAVAKNPDYLILSLPMMVGSGLWGIINYFNERKKYRESIAQRDQTYRAYLADRRHEAESLANEQRRALLDPHPDPSECLRRAGAGTGRPSPRLWERSSGLERPRDPDFLHLRLGLGALPATFQLKPPSSRPPVGEADDLYDEALRLVDDFRQVDGVPIVLPLAQAGAAGLSGPPAAVRETVRALLLQLATHHAPNEVKLVALLPAHEVDEWAWIRWLPHVWDDERKRRYLAASPDEARALLAELFAGLQKRALNRPAGDAPPEYPQNFVFLFADPGLFRGQDASVVGPLLHLLLTQGAAIGAYSIFLADRPETLPAGCRALVECGGSGRLRLIGPPTQDFVFRPDRVNLAQADLFARALAPVRLKAPATIADLPASVPLTALLKTPRLEDFPVRDLWEKRDSHQSLEVPLGIEAGGGVTMLNFQDTATGGDGSHAMVGGTTGTGKTRFLQTLITLLAAHHHPHDLNFILIDYKGGDLLQGLEALPHVVGTLANLEKADAQAVLVERLFVCLEAELRRRRNLLGGRNINQYQRDFLQGRASEPLPHLFVIIDEFAEMIRNSPDKAAMTKRLLSIGATGRSLGVHLVLATQDPSGVVTDELRNNINIRLCLRMGSRQASMDILRRPDAYENISSSQVGRAYLQVGNNDRFVAFQVAWGGDRYARGQAAPHADISIVELDGTRKPLRSFRPLQVGEETQMSALVRLIRETADAMGLQPLRSPLSPPLRPMVFLDELRQGEMGWNGSGWDARPGAPWLAPIIGQMDDPASQAQDPLRLPLGAEGHFVLFGEPGSGKTTFIQTLVTSLALSHPPDQVHIYLVDFGGQRLLSLKGFPHVGDVFLGEEIERLRRFFRYLDRELQTRRGEFARAGASTLQDYRALSGKPVPSIVTILRDYAAFRKACQDQNLDLDDLLMDLVRNGGPYGLHFVLTMNNPTELRPQLAGNISLAATYHLATRDYSMAVGPTGGLEPPPLPGRGLFKGPPLLEFQTALPVQGHTDVERTQALKSLMAAMDRAWSGGRPRSFPPVPAVIGLSQLLAPADRWPEPAPAGLAASFCINLEDPDQPFAVDLRDGPYFLVAGTPQSGKTTLLQSWVLALADRHPPERLLLYLVDFRQSGLLGLSDLPHVRAPIADIQGRKTQERKTGYISDGERFAQALAEIETALQQRQAALNEARQKDPGAFRLQAWLDARPTLLMVIDDFEMVDPELPPDAKDLLNSGLRRWRELGFAMIVAGSTSDMENAWGWIAQLRNAPVGFQMGSAAHNQVFRINLPVDNPSRPLPPGDAFFIRRGQAVRVRIADPQVGPVPLAEWVRKIRQR
jgi:S-DNA-T family DNA segregation ATPase FtsK/SpoIIIE